MRFSKILTHWYSINKRFLPWRSTKDPYKIWLSEIILQQTQIKQGLPYYLEFIEAFPTVFHLANATEQQVLKRWQGLGYYSRARNLHFTAQYIARELNGKFPDNYKDLLKLKGVGDYTASAIASFCFNEPTAVVDGNVYRVLSRYFGIDTPINSSSGIKEFKVLATEIIDPSNPADHNQALMEYGSMVCRPVNPECNNCIFNDSCYALQHNLINKLPIKIKSKKVRKRFFNYLIKSDVNKGIVFEKRTESGIWKNMYQFPLIETEKLIHMPEFIELPALKNFYNEELHNIILYNATEVIHKLSHQHLYTKFWIIENKQEQKRELDFSEIKKYPTPILISNFVNEFESPY